MASAGTNPAGWFVADSRQVPILSDVGAVAGANPAGQLFVADSLQVPILLDGGDAVAGTNPAGQLLVAIPWQVPILPSVV